MGESFFYGQLIFKFNDIFQGMVKIRIYNMKEVKKYIVILYMENYNLNINGQRIFFGLLLVCKLIYFNLFGQRFFFIFK